MKIKNIKRTFLADKIAMGFVIAIGLLGLMIFFCCQYYNLNNARETYRNLGQSCAKSAAKMLYNTNFVNYLKNGKNEIYNEQLAVLNSICQNFKLKYLYVYIPDFDENKVTSIFYVNGKSNENVKGRDLGVEVHWILTKQEKNAYKGLENLHFYVANNYMGHTISSYAPVYNSSGQVIALVGADLDFDFVRNKIIKDITKIVVFLGFCLFLIYMVLISYLKRVFIKPVLNISNKMSNFEKGSDFAPIKITSNDELGQMAKAFNKMVNDINIYVKQISDTQSETIFALAKLAQSRDDDTGKHLERVQQYCILLSNELKKNPNYKDVIDDKFVENLANASILHDIGKVGIPDKVLLKEGKLTDEEFELIKKHTIIGFETLREAHTKFGTNSFIEMGMTVALYHHERFDGKGYPHGLKGNEIPLAARIMAIADVYDALGTKRVYKPAFTQEKCVEIIKEGSGTQFDPDVVDAFLKISDKFFEVRKSMED